MLISYSLLNLSIGKREKVKGDLDANGVYSLERNVLQIELNKRTEPIIEAFCFTNVEVILTTMVLDSVSVVGRVLDRQIYDSLS